MHPTLPPGPVRMGHGSVPKLCQPSRLRNVPGTATQRRARATQPSRWRVRAEAANWGLESLIGPGSECLEDQRAVSGWRVPGTLRTHGPKETRRRPREERERARAADAPARAGASVSGRRPRSAGRPDDSRPAAPPDRLVHGVAGREWSRGDSNPWPSGCQPDALPAELRPHERFQSSREVESSARFRRPAALGGRQRRSQTQERVAKKGLSGEPWVPRAYDAAASSSTAGTSPQRSSRS
jgi:hypothetical protein